MIQFCLVFIFLYFTSSIAGLRIENRRLRRFFLFGALVVWVLTLLVYASFLDPWERIVFSCFGTPWLIKNCVRDVLDGRIQRPLPLFKEIIYRFVWPGMSTRPFQFDVAANQSDGALFVRGYIPALLGIALLLCFSYASYGLQDIPLGVLGLLPFFLLVHLGFVGVLTSLIRLWRHPVPLLFDAPLQSDGLRDFWSRRWNRPFIEMNRALFFPWFVRRVGRTNAVLLTFILSGFLHELGISYPAGGGWGWPTLYFFLQGLLIIVEERCATYFSKLPRLFTRLWTWICVLAPLPLLFHSEFRSAVILPVYRQVGDYLMTYSLHSYMSFCLLMAGLGHFLVLVASVQVPSRLRWKEELGRLSTFNRKIMWNYGFFILMLIIAFGVETLLFRQDMVDGVPSALGMATLICGFWLLRILVDLFYFSHSDWPSGPEFVIGHTLLNSLFLFFVLTYGTVVGWHLWLNN